MHAVAKPRADTGAGDGTHRTQCQAADDRAGDETYRLLRRRPFRRNRLCLVAQCHHAHAHQSDRPHDFAKRVLHNSSSRKIPSLGDDLRRLCESHLKCTFWLSPAPNRCQLWQSGD